MSEKIIITAGYGGPRAIVRSTSSTGGNWMELLWARDEIARRDRLRNGIKTAIVACGGYVTAKD